MKPLFLSLLLLLNIRSQAQYYFPPIAGSNWDTVSPAGLGWCTDQLEDVYTMLDQRQTKAFIILKDGKIAVERYFGSFTKDSIWFWASAGKTVTSLLVGIANQENLLKLSDSTSKYLGSGWTSATPEKERLITIQHQLTMTTGLDFQVADLNCKSPGCLKYKADAGSQWYYHNAPYLLLQDVLENASGMTYQQFTNSRLSAGTGINGLWYDGVFYSKARVMARFGSLILNRANWNGNQILTDTAYFNRMTTTSQPLNESYGYLWWLNGKASFKLPGSTFTFPGPIIPGAPSEMIAALGKYDQKLYVIPSEKMVIVRMGWDADTSSEVPMVLDTLLWNRLNKVFCNQPSGLSKQLVQDFVVYPSPASNKLIVGMPEAAPVADFQVIASDGRTITLPYTWSGREMHIDLSALHPGSYFLQILLADGTMRRTKFIKVSE